MASRLVSVGAPVCLRTGLVPDLVVPEAGLVPPEGRRQRLRKVGSLR